MNKVVLGTEMRMPALFTKTDDLTDTRIVVNFSFRAVEQTQQFCYSVRKIDYLM